MCPHMQLGTKGSASAVALTRRYIYNTFISYAIIFPDIK